MLQIKNSKHKKMQIYCKFQYSNLKIKIQSSDLNIKIVKYPNSKI